MLSSDATGRVKEGRDSKSAPGEVTGCRNAVGGAVLVVSA